MNLKSYKNHDVFCILNYFLILFFFSRPIKLSDFADHFRFLSADSDFRFSEEFELLKHVGRDAPCNAADLPVNRPKNRFTNILPYEHSRIKLMPTDDEEGSDYINGNYIPVSCIVEKHVLLFGKKISYVNSQ